MTTLATTKSIMELFEEGLLKEREALLAYLLAKFDNEDWHGVQDAASDLRDIDCQLQILDKFAPQLNTRERLLEKGIWRWRRKYSKRKNAVHN